jgi:two-component system sensor histidine kinase BaeS
MRTLRARLFAATLATLAVTLALSLGVGLVLTRRQLDQSQATALAYRADDLAKQRRSDVTYIPKDLMSGQVHILIQPREKLARYVPDAAQSSDGTTTLSGVKYLYSYRTLPHFGLLLLRPASVGSEAWKPFQRDLMLSALAGAALAAILSFLVARSVTGPVRRVAQATRRVAAEGRSEPVPVEGAEEIASLARAFNEMAAELARSREAERTFLLSVSHEFKTPLTAIRGYAEGLADGAVDANEASATIAREAGRLDRLVRDVLDLARMNRHTFSVRREPVDLALVGREAVERLEGTARGFGVELAATGGDVWVEADHDRALQIASNLVENALRATPAGGSVRVHVAPGRLTVSDTGPGIPAQDVPRAFERFYLYDRADKSRTLGSGLGLAIVRQLTAAMGGRVWVDTTVGRGATFVVELPPTAAPEGIPERQAAARAPG